MMNDKKSQTKGKPNIERLVREADSTCYKLVIIGLYIRDGAE